MNSIARAAAYDDMATKSIVMGASSHGLITLLFEELDSSLKAAEFFLDHQDQANMRKNLTKASRILRVFMARLQTRWRSCVKFGALYHFCIKELFKANSSAEKTVRRERVDHSDTSAWNNMPEEHRNK